MGHERQRRTGPFQSDGIFDGAGVRGLPPGAVSLYHNNGDGKFTDVSVQSGISKAKGSYCMTTVAADFDNDAWPDIYVACDSTPSFLFKNNHDSYPVFIIT